MNGDSVIKDADVKKRRPRVFVDVSADQQKQLERIPKEYRGLFLSGVITDVVEALKEQGMDFVVNVIQKDLHIKDGYSVKDTAKNEEKNKDGKD